MILACAKIQGKILIFGEAGAPESYMNIRHAPFLSIRFILNNPRLSKWFNLNAKDMQASVIFAK